MRSYNYLITIYSYYSFDHVLCSSDSHIQASFQSVPMLLLTINASARAYGNTSIKEVNPVNQTVTSSPSGMMISLPCLGSFGSNIVAVQFQFGQHRVASQCRSQSLRSKTETLHRKESTKATGRSESVSCRIAMNQHAIGSFIPILFVYRASLRDMIWHWFETNMKFSMPRHMGHKGLRGGQSYYTWREPNPAWSIPIRLARLSHSFLIDAGHTSPPPQRPWWDTSPGSKIWWLSSRWEKLQWPAAKNKHNQNIEYINVHQNASKGNIQCHQRSIKVKPSKLDLQYISRDSRHACNVASDWAHFKSIGSHIFFKMS